MAINLHPSINRTMTSTKRREKKNIIDSLDTLQFTHVESNAQQY